MQKTSLAILAIVAVSVSGIGLAHAQTEEPEIAFSEFQLVIIGIGVLAGLVTAYNGYRKSQNGDNPEPFNITKFLDRVFMAVLGSIPLAIAESANIIKLDLFGAWIVFAAALGTAQLIMEIRTRNN